jgi:uncharacterized protein YcnI
VTGSALRRVALPAVALAALWMLGAGSALAHVGVLPSTGLADGELYALSVPDEVDGATTTRVVLTVPEGFSIGLFVPSPGWERTVERAGAGEDAAVRSVTWRAIGGAGPGEGALFQFTGRSSSPGTFRLAVEQSYSDGTVGDWSGEEDAELPAAFVTTRRSLGGGPSSWLALGALVLAGAALLLGALALARRRGERAA